jgi:ATP-binding cassette subfamily B protein
MADFRESDVQQKFSPMLWKKLLPFLKPLKKQMAFVLVMMLISAAVDALIPLFTRHAVEHFVEPRATEGLGLFTLVYIGVMLVQAITTVLYSRQAMIIEMNMGKDMKRQCLVHLQKLPLSFFNQTSVGYILARVMSDTNRISGMIAWVGAMMLWYVSYLLGILIVMFSLNVKLALLTCAVIPVLVLVTLVFQPWLLRASREQRRVNSRITSSFNESITGAKTTKTLVIEGKMTAEFAGVTSDMYKAAIRVTRLSAVYLPIITFFGSMAVALVLSFGGTMVLSGALSLAVLSAFIACSIAILEPISSLGRFFSEIMDAQVNIERVTALLEQTITISDPPQIEEKFGGVFDPKPENWPPIKGEIEFRDVWFRYPDAADDDFVLEEINLKVPPGATVALVGETGAGKTTMVNLVCRFFEPTRGQVLIDGVDYKERSQIWLRSNIGYVHQSPHLFSGSLADNIRYGKLDATLEEIDAAAKLVSCDIVAKKLEQGYQTDVGEGGDRLSTGEKQLVSFARAMISNPPVFILDEATSSIDTEMEQLIQNAISHILGGRTSFIIAHRLSTIRSADLILLIDGRGIKEQGSHEELMEKRGQYYNLYTAMMIADESDLKGFAI